MVGSGTWNHRGVEGGKASSAGHGEKAGIYVKKNVEGLALLVTRPHTRYTPETKHRVYAFFGIFY
jgi:hypothetical protein